MTLAQNICPIYPFGPLILGIFLLVCPTQAQASEHTDPLALGPTSEDYAQFWGKPIRQLEIQVHRRWFHEHLELRWVKVGDPFYATHLRSAVRDLLNQGHVARAAILAEPYADGVAVRVQVELRRVIAQMSVDGAALTDEELYDAASLKIGDELTDSGVDEKLELIRKIHHEHGYPQANVTLTLGTTNNPLEATLSFHVDKGAPASITQRRFELAPDSEDPALKRLVRAYDVQTGERYDETRLVEADRELAETLKHEGWYQAKVTHSVEARAHGMRARVQVAAGPKFGIAFVGNRTFDADQLRDVLEIDTNDDRSVDGFLDRLKRFYTGYGFLDVHITARQDDQDPRYHHLTFRIDEGATVRVRAKEFPCLSGARNQADVEAEIDSFLAEELPGAGILGP
ncbi:MAG TPA: POTRA domain-containing protein, partial [Polyangiaceae bacterium]|nr:POTRA domain-containing protein [Polyangiaceae bacterium]